MASVFDVAHWFLQKEPMVHKKLQKLCYYAQAWSLALNNKPMFDGEFEAWAHGPVNRELWENFKGYGYVDIEHDAVSKRAKSLCTSENKLLFDVWDTYGDMTAFQLEDLTHKEDPWLEARGKLRYDAPSTNVINKEIMGRYYKSQYVGDGIGE